ncbi:hypothetical protein MKW98_026066 [Papaver atlanticum]|uniref:Uncharacterized protein n=1 Tax=Papaver atlanticum TaxID=357466 RepID=A0AAD4RZD9_9MAGN|nr:hypothetical protein MKW98_026066 [Papaver atlanticum]
MDKRPRKRPRLAWEIPPPVPLPKELPAIYCWEEFMSGVGSRNTGAPLYYKSQIQNGYPPWRNDYKDGHYVFVIRENLTLRYKILSKMGEVLQYLEAVRCLEEFQT